MFATSGRLNTWHVTLSAAIAAALLYIVCVVYDLIFPQWAMHPAWHGWLPGFEWLSWGSFVLGLVEVFVMAGFIVWVFALIYNRLGRTI